MSLEHRHWMELALELARKGLGRTSPNPAVGAVIVDAQGRLAGQGFHTYAGVKHAEVVALEQAGSRAFGGTLYVTLEPCSTYGRTPPCVDAIIKAGVRKVIAAMEDPNPQVSGRGFAKLRQAGVEVELLDEFRPAAEQLNEAYCFFMKKGRPFVLLKAALTLDGKICAAGERSSSITSEIARNHAQRLRYLNDAILVGIGTVLADNPLLTDRTSCERSRPLLRIVLDSRLRIPLESRLVQTACSDVLVVCVQGAPRQKLQELQERGVMVLETAPSDSGIQIQTLMEWLAEKKYLSVIVEGGSKVHRSFLFNGLANKVVFYYAAKILGGTEGVPVVAGPGLAKINEAIKLARCKVEQITPEEFVFAGYIDSMRQ